MVKNNSYNYNDNINILNDIHKIYPEKVEKELSKIVSKLELYDETNSIQKIVNNEKFDSFALIILFIIIALLGLFNLFSNELGGLYYGGLIFFIAGYLINLSAEHMTLIFLFSHGITGLCLMTVPIIYPIIDSPIMSDNPVGIYIWLGLIVFTFILATIFAILYDFVEYFRLKNHAKLIPLIIYLIGIVMVIIL